MPPNDVQGTTTGRILFTKSDEPPLTVSALICRHRTVLCRDLETSSNHVGDPGHGTGAVPGCIVSTIEIEPQTPA